MTPRSRFARLLGALLLTLPLAAATAPDPKKPDTGAKAVDAAWRKAILANDLEGVMKNYATDATVWLPDMAEARGEAAIRAAYKGLLDANTVRDVNFTDTSYRTVGDRSVGWGKFALTMTPKAGGGPVTLKGRFTVVAERRNNRWVYVVDHASSEPAPKPAPAPAPSGSSKSPSTRK